jgi:autotransporter-associated beta strand protein
MKKILNLRLAFALLLAATPLGASATVFFNDTFANGSTINAATPVNPTTNSASYEEISSQVYNPGTPTIAAHDLTYGLANAGGGSICEIQAIFTTNAVTLTEPGDFIQLTIIFTNTDGIYNNITGSGTTGVGFGLYNSGGSFPVGGGMNGTEGAGSPVSGGVQNWLGYMAFCCDTDSSLHNRIYNRAANILAIYDQDLVTQGSSSKSYSANGGVSITPASITPAVPFSTNTVYTNILTITLIGTSQVGITNNLYNATGLVDSLGGTNASTAFTTAAFDGLAMGFYKKGDPAGVNPSNVVDIASITVSGSVTVISGPPSIALQPTNVMVPNGASGAFIVNAQGFNTSYQWHRNGTNINNGGNISIINSIDGSSSVLAIAPAGPGDVLSAANGYSVTISGAGGFSTNSTTNSLSFTTATNLIWQGNGFIWDLNDQATINNWLDTNGNPQVFNFGDPVTFNDTGTGGGVILTGPYLSAASVTVSASSFAYAFGGTGSFAGTGALIYTGSGQLTISNANIYTGGTIISNAAAKLVLQNVSALGSGPVTLAKAGGEMEIVPAGTATAGINGNIIVADNFTIQFDAASTSAGVFFGDFSGTPGKTLSLVPNGAVNTSTNERVRAFGTNTTYTANLSLDPLITFAPYNGSGSQTYSGVISGGGGFMQKGNLAILAGTSSTYSGGTFVVNGVGPLGFSGNSSGSPTVTSGPIGTGPLFITVDSSSAVTGTGEIFASGGSVTLGNPIQYPTGTNNLTLEIGGANAMTFTGPVTLNGNDLLTMSTFAARSIQITNTAVTTLSGVISDLTNGVSAAYGLTIIGNGTPSATNLVGPLVLNNTETYTGPTIDTNGATLLVNGSLAAASAVTVYTNATLTGNGTINGPVTVQQGGILAAGTNSTGTIIGTLSINNNLTLLGNVLIKVNRSVSPSNDVISVSQVLTNAGVGTLTVSNLGPTIVAGNKFTVFNKALTNGFALTVTGAGITWSNRLGIDGSILALGSTVATNPTNILFSIIGGTNLSLSWPADHLGWYLQVQTNALSIGLQTNSALWFDVPNSSNIDSTNMLINPKNPSVFYRLSLQP